MREVVFHSTAWWVLLVLAIMSGCSSVTIKSSDIEKADKAYFEGRFNDAELIYQRVLEDQPNNARVLGQLGLIALWQNNLQAALVRLTAAKNNASWLQRRWPMSAQIDARLAILHARAGRPVEAAELLDKAAGPLAFGPFKELKVRAQQAALFPGNTDYLRIEGPSEITTPFVMTDPLPVVKVSINGAPPVNFFIDTGGESLILDTRYAKEVGAVIAGEVPGEYAGGKSGMTGYGKIDRIGIENLLVHNVPISTIDQQAISKYVFGETEIKGIIGTGFLMQFLATIDYRNENLILRRPLDSFEQTTEKLKLGNEDHIFPLWLVETHLMFSRGSVNNLPPQLMFIDTGLANAGFLTSKTIAADAGIEMDWSKSGEGAGGGGVVSGLAVVVDLVTLGDRDNIIDKHNLDGVIFEKDISIFQDTLGFHIGGLISHQFFRDSSLSFDFVNMRMIVQR